MDKAYSINDANWELTMKDGWCILKLDGKLMCSTDQLENILIFIRKWHSPVILKEN
jgi:hypothetical protein